MGEIQTSADPGCLLAQGAPSLLSRRSCTSERCDHGPSEVGGLHARCCRRLLESDDDRKSDHTTPVQVKEEEEVVTHTTIETNLRQGRQACVAPSEIWLRDDLEEVYALLFRFLGYGFWLATSNVGWLVTQKFVILVPDPIGFSPVAGAVRPRRAS